MRIAIFLLGTLMVALSCPSPAAEGLALHPVPVIEGSVGSRTILVLVDTGLSGVAVDSRLVADLGLEKQGVIRAQTASGGMELSRIAPVDLRIQGLRCREDAVFVATDLGLLSSVYGRRIDAIVGMGLLKGMILVMDYDQDKFRIVQALPEKERPVWARKDMMTRKVNYSGLGMPTINLSDVLGPGAFDTGANDGLILTKERYDLLSSQGWVRPQAIHGLQQSADASGNREGDVVLAVSVNLPDLPTFTVSGSVVPHGGPESLIGSALMRHFNWIVDFSNDTVSFVRSSHFGSPPKTDRSGLGLLKIGTEVVVKKDVDPLSPAGRMGVMKEDVLTHCQGQPVSQWPHLPALREVLAGPEGSTVDLTFKRDGKVREIQLKLESAKG